MTSGAEVWAREDCTASGADVWVREDCTASGADVWARKDCTAGGADVWAREDCTASGADRGRPVVILAAVSLAKMANAIDSKSTTPSKLLVQRVTVSYLLLSRRRRTGPGMKSLIHTWFTRSPSTQRCGLRCWSGVECPQFCK